MSSKTDLDRGALLDRLPKLVYESDGKKRDEHLSQTRLADSVRSLANLHHEREWELVRSVATHLLGALPQEEDVDLDLDEEGS